MAKLDVTSPNGNIAVETFGDTEKVPLVLISGLAMPKSMWPRAFIDSLVAHGFYVVALDNRDCGLSYRYVGKTIAAWTLASAIVRYVMGGHIQSDYRLEDMADDVGLVLQKLGITKAYIAGISMGGMIAQTFCIRYPNVALGLISMSSAVGNAKTGLGQWRAIWRLLVRRPSEESVVESVAQVLSGPAYPLTSQEKEALSQQPKEYFDEQGQRRQVMAILASGDRSSALKKLSLSALVTHGDCDPLIPLKAGIETANLIPHATFLQIDGMGHQLPIAVVPKYVQAICDLRDQVSGV